MCVKIAQPTHSYPQVSVDDLDNLLRRISDECNGDGGEMLTTHPRPPSGVGSEVYPETSSAGVGLLSYPGIGLLAYMHFHSFIE